MAYSRRKLGSQEAGVAFQNAFGTYRMEAAHTRGQTMAARASAAGGVAFIGGSAFAGRRINDSFAVVQMPDFPGTAIYADNQPVGRIDAKGNAFLPRLRAYERNRISINQNDLPMDAKIDTLTLDVTPYFRSGLVIHFPVTHANGATMRILLDDGKPIPAGATVTLQGRKEAFPVAEGGEAYITGLAATNRLRVEWRGNSCMIDATRPKTDDPLPHLGIFRCTGVPR